jgi:alpha-glucosidase
VPLPWSGNRSPFGFSSKHSTGKPWLPQPASFAHYTVEAEEKDPQSMLSLYKQALALRKTDEALGDGPFEWIDLGADALAFRRGDGFICVTNFADQALELPPGELILASTELEDAADGIRKLPTDSTAWLRPQH